MKIVKVIAEDWANYTDIIETTFNFQVSLGEIVGFVVQENKDKIAISHQLFPRKDTVDDVRYTTVIPKKMIKKMEVLKE